MGYEIAVWMTQKLVDNGPGDPASALESFINKTLEETGPSATVDIRSKHPNPPHESLSSGSHWPDTADSPCGGGARTYSDLLDWFDEWHDCVATKTAKDANVLVSSFPGTGGVTGGGCTGEPLLCIAEGSDVGRLASEPYDARGCDLRYSQMYATVLHEIGHAIIKVDGEYTCDGSQFSEEWMGYSYYDDYRGDNYTSPMVTWRWNTPDGENDCCKTLFTYKDQGGECFERPYSDCVSNNSNPC